MKRVILTAFLVLITAAAQAAQTKFYFGWRSEPLGLDGTCENLDTGQATQVCTYPPDKTVLFRVTGSGMDAELKGWFERRVDAFNNEWVGQFSGVALGRTNGDNWDMRIDLGSVPNVSTSTNNIGNYVDVTCLEAGTIYAEIPAARGVHRPCRKMQLILDWTKIQAQFPDGSMEGNVLTHALAGGMLHALGLGWTFDHFQYWNSRQAGFDQPKRSDFHPKDVCRINSWNPADSSTLYRYQVPEC